MLVILMGNSQKLSEQNRVQIRTIEMKRWGRGTGCKFQRQRKQNRKQEIQMIADCEKAKKKFVKCT